MHSYRVRETGWCVHVFKWVFISFALAVERVDYCLFVCVFFCCVRFVCRFGDSLCYWNTMWLPLPHPIFTLFFYFLLAARLFALTFFLVRYLWFSTLRNNRSYDDAAFLFRDFDSPSETSSSPRLFHLYIKKFLWCCFYFFLCFFSSLRFACRPRTFTCELQLTEFSCLCRETQKEHMIFATVGTYTNTRVQAPTFCFIKSVFNSLVNGMCRINNSRQIQYHRMIHTLILLLSSYTRISPNVSRLTIVSQTMIVSFNLSFFFSYFT